jgi:hypothetical protein
MFMTASALLAFDYNSLGGVRYLDGNQRSPTPQMADAIGWGSSVSSAPGG